MNKKIMIGFLSVLTIFFLTAQSCNFGGISSGLAAECVGEGTVVCDGTEAYQCQLASYGVGYYVSRASGYDVSDCGATEEEFDSDTLERMLLSISSDLEDVIADLEDIKIRAAEAETDEDARALRVMKLEVKEIRTTLSEMSDVMDDVADDIADAEADGEDVTDLEALYDTADADLTAAETLLNDVQTQIADALEALLGSGSSTLVVDCGTTSLTGAIAEELTFDGSASSGDITTYAWEFGDESSENGGTDVTSVTATTHSYSDAGDYTATLTIYDADGNEESCDVAVTIAAEVRDDDSDGMADIWERHYGLDFTTDDGADDGDSDGLTNLGEYQAGTDPTDDDSDGDGVNDGDEVSAGTDPLDDQDPAASELTIDEITYDGFSDDGTETYYGVWIDNSGDTDADSLTVTCDVDITSVYAETVTATSGTIPANDGDGVTCTFDTSSIVRNQDYEATITVALTDADGTALDDATQTNTWEEDADEDGLSDYIEIITGFDTTTDDLSAYNLLDFDTDSHDWAAQDSTGDGYIDYYGSTSSGAYASGNVNYAVDGENYVVDLTDMSSDEYVYFDATTIAVDVSSWFIVKTLVKPSSTDTTGAHSIVVLPTATCYKPQYSVGIYNGKYKAGVNVAGTMTYVVGGTVTEGTWQEVVVVYKDSTLYLFVDGTEVTSVTTSGAPLVTTSKDLYLGHSDPSCSKSYDFEGYMDTVYIWGE